MTLINRKKETIERDQIPPEHVWGHEESKNIKYLTNERLKEYERNKKRFQTCSGFEKYKRMERREPNTLG